MTNMDGVGVRRKYGNTGGGEVNTVVGWLENQMPKAQKKKELHLSFLPRSRPSARVAVLCGMAPEVVGSTCHAAVWVQYLTSHTCGTRDSQGHGPRTALGDVGWCGGWQPFSRVPVSGRWSPGREQEPLLCVPCLPSWALLPAGVFLCF